MEAHFEQFIRERQYLTRHARNNRMVQTVPEMAAFGVPHTTGPQSYRVADA